MKLAPDADPYLGSKSKLGSEVSLDKLKIHLMWTKYVHNDSFKFGSVLSCSKSQMLQHLLTAHLQFYKMYTNILNTILLRHWLQFVYKLLCSWVNTLSEFTTGYKYLPFILQKQNLFRYIHSNFAIVIIFYQINNNLKHTYVQLFKHCTISKENKTLVNIGQYQKGRNFRFVKHKRIQITLKTYNGFSKN